MADLGPLTCAGCALLCDDVIVERTGDNVSLRPPCGRGAAWFAAAAAEAAGSADGPAATIAGAAATVDAAVARAAELLRGARRPLVHGFDGATVEDARAAVALADRLGAIVATEPIDGEWPGAPALALRGASTTTLGEIRDRSRLVVIWREDPETTHPRLLERLGLAAGARPGRTLVVVDDRETATARHADVRLSWPRERDLEALTALHARQRGVAARENGLLGGRLSELLGAVEHATFVHGPGLTAGTGGQRRALALHELVRALSHDRHVVTLALPGSTGTRGADDALTWQTGYPGVVDLVTGHPEPVSGTRPLVADAGVDVALRVEGAALLNGVTEIALGGAPGAAVSIRTAAPGVEATGTAHRLDGVPLTLQAPLASGTPTAAALLARLLHEVGAP